MGKKSDVIVYTTSNCSNCRTLKEWLKEKHINFTEQNIEDINVMTNLVMRNIHIQSVPAIQIMDTVYIRG